MFNFYSVFCTYIRIFSYYFSIFRVIYWDMPHFGQRYTNYWLIRYQLSWNFIQQLTVQKDMFSESNLCSKSQISNFQPVTLHFFENNSTYFDSSEFFHHPLTPRQKVIKKSYSSCDLTDSSTFETEGKSDGFASWAHSRVREFGGKVSAEQKEKKLRKSKEDKNGLFESIRLQLAEIEGKPCQILNSSIQSFILEQNKNNIDRQNSILIENLNLDKNQKKFKQRPNKTNPQRYDLLKPPLVQGYLSPSNTQKLQMQLKKQQKLNQELKISNTFLRRNLSEFQQESQSWAFRANNQTQIIRSLVDENGRMKKFVQEKQKQKNKLAFDLKGKTLLLSVKESQLKKLKESKTILLQNVRKVQEKLEQKEEELSEKDKQIESMEKDITLLKNDVNWRKSNEKKSQDMLCKLAKDKNALTIKIQQMQRTMDNMNTKNLLKIDEMECKDKQIKLLEERNSQILKQLLKQKENEERNSQISKIEINQLLEEIHHKTMVLHQITNNFGLSINFNQLNEPFQRRKLEEGLRKVRECNWKGRICYHKKGMQRLRVTLDGKRERIKVLSEINEELTQEVMRGKMKLANEKYKCVV